MGEKYELIISEKPNAAKRIAEALADGKPVRKGTKQVSHYELSHNKKDIVVACAVGHLYTVAEKKKSFKYPSFELEWKPTSEVSKSSEYSKKYLDALRKLSKNASSVTVACDYDVEGEVIGINCVRYACGKKDARRMKFSTLTKEDLVEAYASAEPTINWGLANAGETRHFLDWMYGINISRALTLAVKNAGAFKIMSSGRVQGPALKIVYDKELEIEAFKSTPYWQIELKVEKDQKQIVALHELDKFEDKKAAERAHSNAKAHKAKVESLETRPVIQSPPTPFDLGSLQTEVYKVFGIKPKETLSIAQNLYVQGSISYPRTSSQKLPAKIDYRKILKALSSMPHYSKHAQDLLAQPKLVPNEGKKDDPAHPAIYPTGLRPSKISEREEKVYDLIVRRFMATFSEPARKESMSLVMSSGTEKFKATGSRIIEKNWLEVYKYAKSKEADWPALHVGEELHIVSLELLDKQTQPPKRYTPASIITELEKQGLGTKSTRAEIVESLYQRGYIQDESIKVTDLGKQTMQTLEKYCPEIVDEALTRHFESEMDEIMAGTKTGKEVLEEAKAVLSKVLKEFKSKEDKIGHELSQANRQTLDKASFVGECPNCKGTLRIKFSPKTKQRFVACDNYPQCTNTYALPQRVGVKATEKLCESCKHPIIMVLMKGKRPQEACINKDCPAKHVEHGHKTTEKNGMHTLDRKCPKCGKDLVIRSSIYGKFIGCTGYPKCRHTEKLAAQNSGDSQA